MFDLLTVPIMIFGFIIILIAFIVRGITGFGSGLIAIPLLALMLPITIVVPLVGILDYLSSLAHGFKLRKDICWKQILPLLPFSLLGVICALYLFNSLDPLILKKLLGIFIIIYAIYSLSKLSSNQIKHNKRLSAWSIPGGFLGGLIGTLFGTGGPFYVIYLQLLGFSKAAFRATIAVIFLLDGSTRIIAYSLSGFYTLEIFSLIILSLPIMIIGMYTGGHIHTNMTQEMMKKGISILLLFSGSALLW